MAQFDVSFERAASNFAAVDLLRRFGAPLRDELLVDDESGVLNSLYCRLEQLVPGENSAISNCPGTERLSTALVELRQPVTNMRVAIRLLEIALAAERGHSEVTKSADAARAVDRCLRVLDAECQREINSLDELCKQSLSSQ